MASTAKANEPTMEEILASIRRIIADDEPVAAVAPSPAPAPRPEPAAPAAKPAAAPVAAAPAPAAPAAADLGQDGIDAMFASLGEDEEPEPAPAPKAEAAKPVLELVEADSADAEPDILELTETEGEKEEDAAPEPPIQQDVAFRSEARPAPRSQPVFTDSFAADPAPPRAAASFESREQPDIDSLISSRTDAAVSTAFNSLAHTILTQNARTLEDLVRDMLRPMLKAWLDDNLPVLVERLVRAEIERVSRGGR